MPFRSLLPDLENTEGVAEGISRRTRDLRLSCCWAGFPKEEAMVDDMFQALTEEDVSHDQSCWAILPPELLRNVLQRVELADCNWAARKDVVACSAVCRTWRIIVKELVKGPDESFKLTFPTSLKQPGPREKVMQCFIRREKSTSTFYLYLGLSPSMENSKFLLAARKFRSASSTEYLLSTNSNDVSSGANAFVGKLRSNFMGTKFEVLETLSPPCNGTLISTRRLCKRVGSKRQVCPTAPPLVYNVAHVAYQLNVLGSRGPRRLVCMLHSIGAGGSSQCVEGAPKRKKKFPSLMLKNKAPRWHEQLRCWCLNFRGRVTVASVKNFQLVASSIKSDKSFSIAQQIEPDKVLLQFGKIGNDIFTMDYCYPLSAYQAFAICLTSFGTKLACE